MLHPQLFSSYILFFSILLCSARIITNSQPRKFACLLADEIKGGYQIVAVNDCRWLRFEGILRKCLVCVAGESRSRKTKDRTPHRTHPRWEGEVRKDGYSPVGRTSVVATVVTTASSPVTSRARWATVRLAAVAVHIRVGLVAGTTATTGRWAGWRTVAVVSVATRRRVVVNRWGTSTTRRRAIAVITRVVVVTRRWGATTVVIATRAVAARRATTIVVVVHGRSTVTAVTAVTTIATAAVARRAGAVARLTGTRDLGLRL
jgi:hypothetical protein